MKKILAQHRSQIRVWKKPASLGLEIRQKWFRTSTVKICSRLDVFTLLDKLISPWSQTNVISFTCIKSHQNFTMVAVSYRRRLLANWSGRTFAESWQVWSLYQLIFVNFYPAIMFVCQFAWTFAFLQFLNKAMLINSKWFSGISTPYL